MIVIPPKSEGSSREEFDYRFYTTRDYTVKLTVRDDEGKSASQTITITVKAASQRYYHLADHLGNVRATACPASAEVVSEKQDEPGSGAVKVSKLIGAEETHGLRKSPCGDPAE
jgi:PKD repeat protein